MKTPRPLPAALAVLAALPLAACGGPPDLIVYVSLDMEHSQALIQEFERTTGLDVRAEYDTEASKTVGLVKRLIQEARGGTRCDVFWNNEVAQTVRLAQLGLLQPYDSPSAAGIPPLYRDPDHRWTGFAARARCFIVNTELVPDPGVLTSMWDLLDPAWHGRVGIAKPLTGTTLTHAAALYDAIGEEQAESYLSTIADGSLTDDPPVNVAGSNGQVMRLVESGELAWGWTDTDDFNVARERGSPVARVFPDQTPRDGEDEALGTLVIPNTVAILKDAPHLDAARRFVDWALSPAIEERLAFGRSAQIPVRDAVPRPEHVASDVVPMRVSYTALGMSLEARTEHLQKLFLRR